MRWHSAERMEGLANSGPPADGPRLDARFTSGPFINNYIARDIVFDAAGNMYVSDLNKVQKIDPSGNVSTPVFSRTDPMNDQSPIQFATGLAIDREQNLYVADAVANRIWKIVLRRTEEKPINLTIARDAGQRSLLGILLRADSIISKVRLTSVTGPFPKRLYKEPEGRWLCVWSPIPLRSTGFAQIERSFGTFGETQK